MTKTKYHCKDCVMFNDDDPKFPYCLGKDLYTYANPDNETCEGVVLNVYHCKDCIFFDNDNVCKSDTVEMYTANFSEACSRFEYKNEFNN